MLRNGRVQKQDDQRNLGRAGGKVIEHMQRKRDRISKRMGSLQGLTAGEQDCRYLASNTSAVATQSWSSFTNRRGKEHVRQD